MAITGRRFLDLNKVGDLVITDHAQDRLSEVAGFTPTAALAKVWFQNARQLRADEMHELGYRPGQRKTAFCSVLRLSRSKLHICHPVNSTSLSRSVRRVLATQFYTCA